MPPTDVDVDLDAQVDLDAELAAVRRELKLMLERQVDEALGVEARVRYEQLLAREQLLLIRVRQSHRP